MISIKLQYSNDLFSRKALKNWQKIRYNKISQRTIKSLLSKDMEKKKKKHKNQTIKFTTICQFLSYWKFAGRVVIRILDYLLGLATWGRGVKTVLTGAFTVPTESINLIGHCNIEHLHVLSIILWTRRGTIQCATSLLKFRQRSMAF